MYSGTSNLDPRTIPVQIRRISGDAAQNLGQSSNKNRDDNCLLGGLSPTVKIIIYAGLDSE